MATGTLALPLGMSFCEADGRLVFLDTIADRYFCLPPDLEQRFRAWTAGTHGADCSAELVRAGILQWRQSADVRPVTWPPIPLTMSRIPDCPSIPRGVLALAAWHMAASAIAFRCLPFRCQLDNLARRKRTVVEEGPDADQAAAAVAGAFRRLALFAAPRDRCLPRSLALAHALIDRQVRPELVIGVRLNPFGAHCWIQHRETLLNESPDQARLFTPILII